MKAQNWILAKQFEGKGTDENIKLVEEELPELKENGNSRTLIFSF